MTPEQIAHIMALVRETIALAGYHRMGAAVVVSNVAAVEAALLAPQAEPTIAEVIGCFDAAIAEGLEDALTQTTDARLKDLVERRLMHALYAAMDFENRMPTEVTPSAPTGKDSLAVERDERAMFEAWAEPITALAKENGQYVEVMTSLAWEAWQARAAHVITQKGTT